LFKLSRENMKVIPIYAFAGITGFESPAAEYKELGLSLDELLIQHPHATFIGQAKGNSMEGNGIYDGDLLIVDRAITTKQNDVIVANYNGSFVCKVLDKRNKCLVSSSGEFAPVFISEMDEFQIEGVVTQSIRLHRSCAEIMKCLL